MRTLLYIFGATALVSCAVIFSQQDTTVADYAPRTADQVEGDYFGALDVYQQLRANVETGQIEPEDYIRMKAAVEKYSRQVATQKDSDPISWIEMGPDNVGGRCRSLLIMDENNLMTGGVSGGLWKTTNQGDSWSQVLSFPNCNVTSIAQAGNGDIYVGTGSLFDGAGGEGGSGFRGQGVYRSTDGGESWAIIPDTDPGLLGSGDWTAVDAIETDPNNSTRVYVGADAGFGYIDNGELFMGVADGLPGNAIQDIHIADDGSYMLVVAGSGRVYRSTNSAFTEFEEEFGNGDGELPQSGIGRARVYVVPQNPEHAYAVYATSSGFFGGLYHSEDNGLTWDEIWPGGIDESTPLPRNQGIYDLALGASPLEPELAYVAGIEIWRAGADYTPELAAFSFDAPGIDIDVHADVHEVRYSPAGVMWTLTDGGLYKSFDNGNTFIESNRGFNVTQYYGIAYPPGNGVIGGTQDNGSHFIPEDGSLLSDLSALDVTGGDGFDCAIPQVTDAQQQVAFTTSQNGVLYRVTSDGGVGDIYDDEIIDLIDDNGDLGQFYTCIRLYEETEDELSQEGIILINPYEETISDSTFILQTNNMDINFEWTMPEGLELRYWEELIRPDTTVSEELTEDPHGYFWLDPQDLTQEIVTCDTTFTQIGEEEVIDEIIPVDSCFYFEPLDSIICITVDYDTTYTMEPVFDIDIFCETEYFYESDTLYNVREQIIVKDEYSSMLTIGFRGSEGIWMTRQGLNFNVTPNWFRLGDAPNGGGAKAIEYVVGDHPEAGDVMLVSGWDGKLWRISGLDQMWTDESAIDTLNNATGLATGDFDDDGVPDGDGYADVLQFDEIFSTGNAITGVAIDPNDPDHVVITIGGYGGSQKVRESFNAMSENPTFSNIWVSGDLAGMPCYDAIVDVTDETGQTIVVGTEFGMWVTNDGGDTWVPSNEGMGLSAEAFACPVFDVKQQWRSSSRFTYPTNNGFIYAGTHGRGIFKSEDYAFVSVDEPGDLIGEPVTGLLVFPNPVTADVAQISLDLTTSTNVRMTVFSSTGQLVLQENVGNLAAGNHILQIDAANLSNGNYIVGVEANGSLETAHFVVMK
ncbi:MAG: T9SS type A sorting domain-containing protein [Flavobacteriales bacterium]|nr:T9SS type A sorting domain-containing protein [Flavobacteriales bacterium]